MATTIKSAEELRQIGINALQSAAPDLTDTHEGSIIDTLYGAFAQAASEINKGTIDKFNKTFFNTANGSAVTGGSDDLAYLATDHFGSDFARPAAVKAVGTVTFSRPTNAAGDIVIPAGTIVKTAPNANGVTQRFETLLPATISNPNTINASVRALVAGTEGNVSTGACNLIESSLLDTTIVVTNALAFSGGAAEQDDTTYRETIRAKVVAIRGAILAAIEAKAKTVSGVVMATALETVMNVIAYDIATGAIQAGSKFFRIPFVYLYIADANGTADSTLVAEVDTAVATVRAAGVRVNIAGATPLSINWTASITLNPAGPNFAALSSSTQLIRDSMSKYINDLPIGTGFVKATANAAMLAIWGAAGTNDITAFTTSVPAGDVAGIANQKLIAGTMVAS